MVAQAQPVAHAHALVEHKAFALPGALLRWNFFQVLEDATFEVIHLVKTAQFHERSGFFAADTACAKHGHFGFFDRIGFQVFLRVQPSG